MYWRFEGNRRSMILVTGHKGYIGSHLYSALIERGYSVIGMDLKDNQNILFHLNNIKEKINTVFHLAAIPSVAYSVENPSYSLMQNVLGTSTVLEWAMINNVNRVVFSSSAAIYGNGNGPTSPYGLHKLMAEKECKLYSDLYGLDTVSLRYFNVYSPCQETSGAYSTVVANWMEALRNGTNPFITGDGSQSRDMLWLDDAVDANIFCMMRPWDFHGEFYDCGTGENITLNDLKDLINEHHPDVEFDYVEERKGDVLYTKAHTAPLEEAGWKSKKSIRDGMVECFKNIDKV